MLARSMSGQETDHIKPISLSRRFLSAVGAFGGELAFRLGVRRAITENNIQHAYPAETGPFVQRVAKNSFRNLGITFLEMLYLRYGNAARIKSSLTITNLEFVRAVLARDRGVILLSAHLANWEWMAVGTGLLLEQPLYVIVKNQKGNAAERFLTQMRTRFGNFAIPAGDGRSIFKFLKEGKIVAMLGDQAAPAASVRVPFFGREVPTFEGAARFALRTRSAILLAECLRNSDGTYKMTFHEVDFSDLMDGSEENVKELTRRHAALLESIIRNEPSLWLWQHRRWKDATN